MVKPPPSRPVRATDQEAESGSQRNSHPYAGESPALRPLKFKPLYTKHLRGVESKVLSKAQLMVTPASGGREPPVLQA